MNYHSGRGWREVRTGTTRFYRFDPAAFPGIVFYMATHKYLKNIEGGYYYRYQPNLPQPIPRLTKDKKPYQTNLFELGIRNPVEEARNTMQRSLTGSFQDKYHDKAGHIILLLHQSEIVLTDLMTGGQEIRKLSSTIEIEVTPKLYSYPFEKNKIYSITIDEIFPL